MTRIFHVSDLHFGAEDKQAIQWFADRVNAEMPDAVICTGDLTMRARSAEFQAAAAYLEAMPVPLSVEPGNHDLPYFNLFERFFRPYRRYGRVEKMVERPIDLDQVTVVPLRTTARAQWRSNWSWGVVNQRSLAKARSLLAQVEPSHLAIVACHHPLIDKEGLMSRGKTLGGRRALKALAEAGAHAVLSGHVHDPFDIEYELAGRKIRKIGAGTLSTRTRSTPPSFNELVVEKGELTVVVRTMDAKPPEVLETVQGRPATPIPAA